MTVAVLGAIATILASAIAVFGHWLADRRLRAHELLRARRDAYARYLAVEQQSIALYGQTIVAFDFHAEYLESPPPPSIVHAVNAAHEDSRNHDLRELVARVRNLQDEAATALYAVVLVAGAGVRATLVTRDEGTEDLRESAASFGEARVLRRAAEELSERAARTAERLKLVEAAMRKELAS